MNKNIAIILILVSVTVFGGIETQIIDRAVAQSLYVPPSSPDTNPPSITIQSPIQRQIYNLNNVHLNFTVNKPETWFSNGAVITDVMVGYVYGGQITFVRYNLDGNESENIPANDIGEGVYESPPPRTLDFSLNLTGLPEGAHTLTVRAVGVSEYYNGARRYNTVIGNSTEISFVIDMVQLKITGLSIMNKTYSATEIPLSFAVNKATSWISYSLDGKTNVTTTGNFTLTGISKGSHSIIVYANDTTGNTGASETVYFSIADVTSPTSSFSQPSNLSSTPSMPQQSSSNPTIPTGNNLALQANVFWIAAATAILAVGLIAVVAILKKKQSPQNTKQIN